MATLNELTNRLFALSSEHNYFIPDAIVETKNELIEYQKSQMLHGLNAEGSKIGRYKNKDYARKKANMNPLAGYWQVDLRYRGEFHRNMDVKFFTNSFQVFSRDEKYDMLTEKYGETIWGLNDEFARDYSATYLKEVANRKTKNFLYGRM